MHLRPLSSSDVSEHVYSFFMATAPTLTAATIKGLIDM